MNETLFAHYILERRHHAARRPADMPALAVGYAAAGLDFRRRMADRFARAAAQETPYMVEGEKIVLAEE